jgi:hypothetical protein
MFNYSLFHKLEFKLERYVSMNPDVLFISIGIAKEGLIERGRPFVLKV